MEWLNYNVRYPSIAMEQGIQGRVDVQFVVNKEGRIEDVEAVFSPDASLAKEAVRVIKTMPRWIPAQQGSKPIRSRFKLPVNFSLH